MSSSDTILKRIDELITLKVNAQRACRLEAAKPPPAPVSEEQEEKDSLDWTNEDWKLKESVVQGPASGGYRNASQLAEATYRKELQKNVVDQEKYDAAMKRASSNSAYTLALAPEDIDAVAQGLREASERRQKRRRVGDGGLYMNDRNRQFNLKLDREFGKSND